MALSKNFFSSSRKPQQTVTFVVAKKDFPLPPRICTIEYANDKNALGSGKEAINFVLFSKDHLPHQPCKGHGTHAHAHMLPDMLPCPPLYEGDRFLLQSFSM